MTRSIRSVWLAAVVLGVVGCTPEDRETVEGLPAVVQQAAAFVRALGQDSEDVQEVLREQGLTVAGLDSLMYEIASSPELSTAFEEASR